MSKQIKQIPQHKKIPIFVKNKNNLLFILCIIASPCSYPGCGKVENGV